ncbi:hypothetical protein NDU88_002981 [Pleurodeles waltl]|uniref:Uncharacterized protein n=1 Tax=Pleurodeles waltl TaxID=8319 RepID=A0AAV7MCL4_PLEWA|nr:hypothetical protein NDU88_002981 [Pleurodeles waltl]
MISTTLRLPLRPPQSCLWCLHPKLLANEPTAKEIRNTIPAYLTINNNPHTSMALVWDILKAVVRGAFIEAATKQNKDRQDKRTTLDGQVRALENTHRQTSSHNIRRQRTLAKKQLEALDLNAAEHALFHTRKKYYAREIRQGNFSFTDYELRPFVTGLQRFWAISY